MAEFLSHVNLQLISFSPQAVIALVTSCQMELEPPDGGCVFSRIKLNSQLKWACEALYAKHKATTAVQSGVHSNLAPRCLNIYTLVWHFNHTFKCTYSTLHTVSTGDLVYYIICTSPLMFISVMGSILCVHSCILRHDAPQSLSFP